MIQRRTVFSLSMYWYGPCYESHDEVFLLLEWKRMFSFVSSLIRRCRTTSLPRNRVKRAQFSILRAFYLIEVLKNICMVFPIKGLKIEVRRLFSSPASLLLFFLILATSTKPVLPQISSNRHGCASERNKNDRHNGRL